MGGQGEALQVLESGSEWEWQVAPSSVAVLMQAWVLGPLVLQWLQLFHQPSCSWYCSFQSCVSIGIPQSLVIASVTAGRRQLWRPCYNPWPGEETSVFEI